MPVGVDGVSRVRGLGSVSIAQHTGVDPSVTLAERAAMEALPTLSRDANRVPCVLGVSKGAVHALAEAVNTGRIPEVVARGPVGFLASKLEERLNVTVVRSFVAACASSLTAVHYARLMMSQPSPHAPRRVLVATSEAALLPMFIHSYRRLGVLTQVSDTGYRGRPLHRHRSGFMLAEVGAAVMLERLDHPHDKSDRIELLNTAIACDGFDLIRPDPGMPALQRVADEVMANQAIQCIHPHATGTVEHDPPEVACYASVYTRLHPGAPLPHLYAHKGALGHTLGASGLVSLVIACLCARAKKLPPMPWLDDPIDTPLQISREAITLLPNATHAVFAAGFGGHVAGTVVRRVVTGDW